MGNGSTADVSDFADAMARAKNTCRAMAEQRRHDGRDANDSVPQQFVQLVGFRDPDARRAPARAPAPALPKALIAPTR